jgi:hypothetical protein
METDAAFAETLPSATKPNEGLTNLESAIDDLNSEFIFVCSPVGVLHVLSREVNRVGDFRLLLANRSVLDRNEVKRLAPVWLASPKRAQCTKLVYEPSQPAGLLQDGTFNLHRPANIEHHRGDIGPWCRLLDHVFRDAPRERVWFEQWVAYPLRYPGTKLFTAAVLWGTHGAGKSLLGEVVGKLYGENYSEPSQDDLDGQFNEWLRFRQFILVNEIVSTGRRPDANRLKAMITREYVTINRKYQPQYQVRDCVNYILTSNHPDAIMVEDSERRFFVHRVTRVIDSGLANEIARFKASGDGQASLLHYLLREVDLQGFDPHAPALETAAKRDMVESGIGDLERFILDVIDAARQGQGAALVMAEQLKEKFEGLSRTNRTSAKAITATLQKYGAVSLGQRRISGVRGRWWRLAETEKRPLTGEGI